MDKLEKVHKEAIDRFELIQNRERDQRKLAIEDMRFAHTENGQWDDDAIEKRANRPRYTINRIAPALDQLVGDQRQNRTDIKVRPVSGGADADKANIFNGLIRNIEAQSQAKNAYDGAYDEAVCGGYGGWRIINEYNDDDSFEQDLRIKPINSAASSLYFDPSAKEYDKRDANYAFLTTYMQKDEYQRRFKDALPDDFDQETFANDRCRAWVTDDQVRVAEYWVKVPFKKRIGLLSNGKVIDLDEESAALDELQQMGITVVKERVSESTKVVSYLVSGHQVLKGPMPWAGKYIPLVPVYGKCTDIEGKTNVRGLVRFAKDAQRIYNYAISTAIETTALTPKDPYWMTPAQAKGHEIKLRTFNKKNDPFMFYNVDPKAPGAPQRTGAPSVQTAIVQQAQQASQDIYSVTGIQPPSLGINPELQSGRAIIAQQKMGDRGSFVFTDNLTKSIQYTGDILVDLIPKIYDTERMVRVLGIDGQSNDEPINMQALDEFNMPVIDQQTGKTIIINDLSVGKYDVVIETGPAYSTQRQESAQQLIELASGSEVFQQIALDLIAKNLNVLESDELTQRVRKMMIQQGTVEPTDEEREKLGLNQPQQPDPTQQALVANAMADTQKKAAEAAHIQAKTAAQVIKTQQETIRSMEIMASALKDKVEAGIPLTQDDLMLLVSQADLIKEGQQELDPGPNTVQRTDIINQVGAFPA